MLQGILYHGEASLTPVEGDVQTGGQPNKPPVGWPLARGEGTAWLTLNCQRTGSKTPAHDNKGNS